MTIDEYLRLIREKFSYLFSEYGFRAVYKQEYRPGYGWFRIGLESSSCRILFVREQGGGIMFLGPKAASFDNEDDPEWVVMLNLLSYVKKKEWNWSFLKGAKTHEEKTVAWLSFNAKEFEPYCSQLIEMFQSQEIIRQWKAGYNQYQEEKFRTEYGLK